MKVHEYRPFYGLLYNSDLVVQIENKDIPVKDLLYDYDELEINEFTVELLDMIDRNCLMKALQDLCFTNENIGAYLRGILDRQRENGRSPIIWLNYTFEYVNLNPTGFRPDLITTIEKCLVEWIELFNKMPYDLLYERWNCADDDINTLTSKELNSLWFRAGMLFATGEIEHLMEKFKNNFTHIAHHLGDPSLRPYLSDSFGGNSKREKNIFARQSKLQKIKNHCESKNIPMIESFTKMIRLS